MLTLPEIRGNELLQELGDNSGKAPFNHVHFCILIDKLRADLTGFVTVLCEVKYFGM